MVLRYEDGNRDVEYEVSDWDLMVSLIDMIPHESLVESLCEEIYCGGTPATDGLPATAEGLMEELASDQEMFLDLLYDNVQEVAGDFMDTVLEHFRGIALGECRDALEYRADPYSYLGVRRGDFI